MMNVPSCAKKDVVSDVEKLDTSHLNARKAVRTPSRVATSTPHNPAPVEPQSAISRIRALYAQFTPEEKEEVVNIAEAEGF